MDDTRRNPRVGSRVRWDLTALAEASRSLRAVLRSDLSPGDTLLVRTKNSTYLIGCLGDGEFAVTGGWFSDNQGASARVAISGCTWGRRAILVDVVAAPGLFLEFGNGVRTTRIQAVSRVSGSSETTRN